MTQITLCVSKGRKQKYTSDYVCFYYNKKAHIYSEKCTCMLMYLYREVNKKNNWHLYYCKNIFLAFKDDYIF